MLAKCSFIILLVCMVSCSGLTNSDLNKIIKENRIYSQSLVDTCEGSLCFKATYISPDLMVTRELINSDSSNCEQFKMRLSTLNERSTFEIQFRNVNPEVSKSNKDSVLNSIRLNPSMILLSSQNKDLEAIIVQELPSMGQTSIKTFQVQFNQNLNWFDTNPSIKVKLGPSLSFKSEINIASINALPELHLQCSSEDKIIFSK
jgi:hypothetical protein